MKPKTFYSILCLMFLLGGSLEYSVYRCNPSVETLLPVFCSDYAGKCCLRDNGFLQGQTGHTKKRRQNKKSPALSVPVFGRSVAHHICCLCFCSMTAASILFLYFKTSALQPLNAANHLFFAAASCLIVPE